MANWKDQAAQLGMGSVVAGLKAVERGVSKKQYKRVLATAVAQLLETHPDLDPGQARRRARKVTGAKPAKQLLAASGAALNVAGKLARKVTAKPKDAVEQPEDADTPARQA